MNTMNKALIAVLGVQAVLVVLSLSRDDSTGIGKPEPVVPEFVADKVERIEVFKGLDVTMGDDPASAEPTIVVDKRDGTWVLSSHYNYPAGQEKIEGFFDKVAGLQSRGPIATAEARQSQLRVAEDRYIRKVAIHQQGRQEPIILYIGQPASSGTTAVRVHGRDGVHSVRGLRSSDAQAAVVGWVDTTYFEIEEKSVTRVSVENAAGTFSFEREGEGDWKLASDAAQTIPEGQELKQQSIDSLVRQMAILKLILPVDPEIRTGSPLATVTLQLESGATAKGEAATPPREQYTFVIGPEQEGRYVTRTGDAPPVLISQHKLNPIVNFGPDKMFRPARPAAEEGEGNTAQTPAQPPMPAPGGTLPGGNPHGGAPQGGNPHGGGAPQGGNPHGGGAPQGGNPHGGSPH